MYYLFGIIAIAVYIVAKYLFKLSPQISLLTAALLGSLFAGLPEFWYRWFFAFGGVTDILLTVSLGILIVILLNKLQFFSTSINKINENVANRYLNILFKTIIFAIPGMISGSFIVTGMVLRSSLEFTEENSSFLWFAAFIGVISPPVNIYYKLLDVGLIGGYGFGGLNIINDLAIVAGALLIISPLIFKKTVIKPRKTGSSSMFFISGLFIVIFLIGEVILRRLRPEMLFPGVINFFLLFIIMAVVFLYYANNQSQAFLESLKVVEKDFRAALPYLFLILGAGFIIAMSVHTGFRGSLIIFLEGVSNIYYLVFVILASLGVAIISPFLSLPLIALPALFVSPANNHVYLAFVITLPLFYYIVKRNKSIEGEEAPICLSRTTSRILIILITVLVWGNAFIRII